MQPQLSSHETALLEADSQDLALRDPEDGLRDLNEKDWVVAGGFAAAMMAVVAILSPSFIPEQFRLPVLVLGAGMGLLAYLDHCTLLIRDKHNLVFGIAAMAAMGVSALVYGDFPWITALIGAASIFTFFLLLARLTNFAGGGDIKLSPIPGAVLAAVSPLAACLWLLFTFLFCLVAMVVTMIRATGQKESAMAPYMALALIPALVVSSVLMNHLGLA